MAFLESPRFPDSIAFWLTGGRGFKTTCVEVFSGAEYRDAAWVRAKGKWSVSEALRIVGPDVSAYAIKPLMKYLFATRGQLHGFRVKAPFDNADDGAGVLGLTGVGVASTLIYQMYKNYDMPPLPVYQQIVTKPVGSTIKVYKNGVLQTLTTDYSIDATTGLITFVLQPTIGQSITWTGLYDVPVRFGNDVPDIGMESTGALVQLQNLVLIELKNL